MVRAEPASTPEELTAATPAPGGVRHARWGHHGRGLCPVRHPGGDRLCARDPRLMAIDPAYRGAPLASFRPRGRRAPPGARQDRLAFTWNDHPDQILRRVRGRPVRGADRAWRPAGERLRRAPARRRGRRGPPASDRGAPPWPDRRPPRRRGAGRDRRRRRGLDRPRQAPARRRRPGAEAPRRPCRPRPADRRRRASCIPVAPPGRAPTHQVIRYRREGQVGWIHAEPYNGAASTAFCGRPLDALRYAADQDTNAIALVGGKVAFNKELPLGVIEAADDPRAEAWANIRRIDDVAELIFKLPREVIGRRPRSRCSAPPPEPAAPSCRRASTSSWPGPPSTSTTTTAPWGCPARAPQPGAAPCEPGEQAAEQLLTDRLPISPMAAQRLGLVDGVEPDNPADFDHWARQVATSSPPGPQGPAAGRHRPVPARS